MLYACIYKLIDIQWQNILLVKLTITYYYSSTNKTTAYYSSIFSIAWIELLVGLHRFSIHLVLLKPHLPQPLPLLLLLSATNHLKELTWPVTSFHDQCPELVAHELVNDGLRFGMAQNHSNWARRQPPWAQWSTPLWPTSDWCVSLIMGEWFHWR